MADPQARSLSNRRRLVIAAPRRQRPAAIFREGWSLIVALIFALIIWAAVGSRISDSSELADVPVEVVPPTGYTFLAKKPLAPAWDVFPSVRITFTGPKERVREVEQNPERVKVSIRPSIEDIQPGEERTFVIVDSLLNLPQNVQLVSVEPRDVLLLFDRRKKSLADVRAPAGLIPPTGWRFGTKSFEPARVSVQGPAADVDALLRAQGGVVCRPFEVPVPADAETATSEQRFTVELDLPQGLGQNQAVEFVYRLAPDYDRRIFEVPVNVLLSPADAGTVKVTPIIGETVSVMIRGPKEALDRLEQEMARGEQPISGFVDLRDMRFDRTEPGRRRPKSAIVQLRLPTTVAELQQLRLPPDTRFDFEPTVDWKFEYETIE